MKNNILFKIIKTILIIFFSFTWGLMISHILITPKVLEYPQNIQVIDLPEEINNINIEDNLIGYIRNDTLFIRFNNVILHNY